ncbi:hypothetical protein V1512DRAFT_257791 [Lipomyces arxii]|uniref:uncharacterized protein n=1 Tax=Lipomyces arxii TaxID=56418 RepID=UPI0034CFEF8A
MASVVMAVPRSSSRTRRSPSPKSASSSDPLNVKVSGEQNQAVAATAAYSASAQLRFLSNNKAANAELFWQMHSARRNSESSGTETVARSAGDLELVMPASSALVYIHMVKPTDTIPSVMFTYKIDGHALRQANRLWAHDSIQSRATLLVPVDRCSISMQLHLKADPSCVSEAKGVPEGAELMGWAVVDNVGEVELCAVPRSSLGFFPARRHTNDSRASMESTSTVATEVSTTSTVATESSTTTAMDQKPVITDPQAEETPSFFGSAFKAMTSWRSLPSYVGQTTKPHDAYEMVPDS